MNALRIFGENFVNGDCAFTFSSGSALAASLYDQNQATKWLSSGSSDAAQETIEVAFKNWQGSAVTRTFDRLILLNHNIKAGGLDYWDADTSAWVAIASAAISANAAANLVVDLAAPVSTTKIRLRMDTAIVTNAEKFIGELKVCLSIFTGTQQWLSDMRRYDDQRAGAYRLAGGALVQWREYTKFGATLQLTAVAKADRDTLMPYLTSGGWLTLVPYYDHDASAVYEVAVVSAPSEALDRKTGLYELSMEVKER